MKKTAHTTQTIQKKGNTGADRSSYWIAMGTMGTLVAAGATAGPATPPSYAAQIPLTLTAHLMMQTAPTFRFDIPAGQLGETMAAFQRVTGLRITMSRTGFDILPSPGIRGEYTAERALQQILVGSGLAYRYTAADAVSLDLQTLSTAVDVSTSAPGTVVSSGKYTESLREIPQTIEVIPQSVLQEQGAVTLSDALRNVPGITMQAGEGGGASSTTGDMFNLRGFNASNSIFVDGVRDDGLISRNVFNLEQVEVYLGPTGSDVGRGTASGYINMQTKTANLRPAYSGTMSYDTADQKRGSIDINQPVRLGPQGSWLARAAVRLNAMWQGGGVAGREIATVKNRAIAPTVALGLGTPTRLTLSSQITRQNNLPDYGVPTAAWTGVLLGPNNLRAQQPVEDSNYYGSLDYDFDKTRQENFTGRVEHDINDNLTLRFQSRYNQARRDAFITGIGGFTAATQTVAIQRQGNERKNRIASNQFNAVGRFSTGSVSHALSGGVEYSYEDQDSPTRTGFGTRAPVNINNPNPRDVITGFAPGHSGAYSRGWTNTLAMYAFDTVDISRLQLTGGVRWEKYGTNFRQVSATNVTTTEERSRKNLVSGKVGALLRLTQQGNVYFSYGTSLTPPGTANFTLSAQATNVNNPNVKPQESRNYEVGTKWSFFRNRLLANFAAFHTINKNVIFVVDSSAVPPIFNYDDGQRVDGISIGGVGQITDRLQLIANFGYIDSEIQTQNTTATTTNGKRLALTPRNSGSLWATYKLPFGLNLGGGIRFTSTSFVNTANTIKVPGHQVADMLAEYPINEHFSFRVNIYNVTNEDYVRSVNNNANRYMPGSPRSAMVTTAFRF